jgi:hypothetical protein
VDRYTTGYASDALPAAFRDLPRLRKPFGAGQLEAVAWEAFAARGRITAG